MPNCQNFVPDQFALDLSKEYLANEKLLKKMNITHRAKHFLNTVKCENETDDVFVIWVIMWCLCFKFIYSIEEKRFRVNQLIGVLLRYLKDSKTFKQTLPLFEDVLNTILTFGDFTMVTQILILMNHLNIKKNSTIDNIFFMAFRKNREISKKMHDKKNPEPPQKITKISDTLLKIEKKTMSTLVYDKLLDNSSKESIQAKRSFMRRTFKSFRVS